MTKGKTCGNVSDWIHSRPTNTLIRSTEFVAWLDGLRDKKGKARILSRLDLAAIGDFGDCESVGESVSEMRIHYGPGYRVYHMRRDEGIFMILNGGDKSTQKRDIKRARRMAAELKQQDSEKKRAKRKSKTR